MFRPTHMSGNIALALAVTTLIGWSAWAIAADTVVVYSSLDREFSEPILKAYEKSSGARVLSKFDVESTKTVGLTNLIIAEAARPRCDLFWNNEILNTLRLKEKGLLAPFHPSRADDLPGDLQGQGRNVVRVCGPRADPHRQYQAGGRGPTGPGESRTFSTRNGRARSGSPSRSSARRRPTPPACSWPGATRKRKAIFRDLKANGVQVLSGNKQVATGCRLGPDRLRPDRHRRRDG